MLLELVGPSCCGIEEFGIIREAHNESAPEVPSPSKRVSCAYSSGGSMMTSHTLHHFLPHFPSLLQTSLGDHTIGAVSECFTLSHPTCS
jgi:hypothetical protein